ncbi:MAG: peptidoglycan-associated lipoprotein Pal [Acidobacteria bacterium]|nr:peptidoglycan-associated lipoprotein Pal [Acidobacteriota bacterium]
MSLLRHRHPASLLVLAACLSLAACGGKKRPPALTAAPPPPPPAGSGLDDTLPTQPIDEGPDVVAMEGESAAGSDLESDYASAYEQGSPLADVQFAYDSSALTEAARATLEKHALWLQGRRDVRVTIEGHCDQRGTTEYNLALGEQRARAVWDYLVGLGVAPERLRTVSYGKEQPLDPSENEAAYAKNRRAHFSVSQ